MERSIFLSAVCRRCMEEKETVLEPPERVVVSLAERPFGMTPSKVDETQSLGYVVAKVTEGKPASRAGVRPGWRAVKIGGASCEGLDLEAAQALMKAAELPASVEFEAVPGGADFCTACQRLLPAPLFSRKMRTKPPDKRRFTACVEA